MPAYKFDKPTDAPQNELLTGDYPFQIVSVDFSLCKWETKDSAKEFGHSEKGCDQMELKIAVFKDTTFTQKLAQWTEYIVFHPKWAWKLHQFTASTHMQHDGRDAQPGDEINYDESTVIGLRGWVKLKPEQDRNDKEKRYNRVWVWLSDKEKLPRHVADEGAPEDPDKVPF
jgi:hypothetical protein